MQEQSLMTAPLIVRSAEDLRADRQEVVLMLHDFSFQTPDALLAALTKSNGSQSAMPKSGMGNNMNMDSGSMGAMNSGTMGAMNMGPGMEMDLNDIDYDAFLANDRTFADPEVIRTEPRGRVRLRLINAASATQFWIDLGALTGTVIAADGHPVRVALRRPAQGGHQVHPAPSSMICSGRYKQNGFNPTAERMTRTVVRIHCGYVTGDTPEGPTACVPNLCRAEPAEWFGSHGLGSPGNRGRIEAGPRGRRGHVRHGG